MALLMTLTIALAQAWLHSHLAIRRHSVTDTV